MRDGGKIQAAIEVLRDVLERRTPVKEAVRDWGKRSRFAGSRDRAWISGLVVDALRRKNSIEFAMEDTGPRALALGALKHAWGWDVRKIEEALKDDHAPPPLKGKERENLLLAPHPSPPQHVQGDFPEWLTPHLQRRSHTRYSREPSMRDLCRATCEPLGQTAWAAPTSMTGVVTIRPSSLHSFSTWVLAA